MTQSANGQAGSPLKEQIVGSSPHWATMSAMTKIYDR